MQGIRCNESSAIVATFRGYISGVRNNIAFIFWNKINSVFLQYKQPSTYYRKQSTCYEIIHGLTEWN